MVWWLEIQIRVFSGSELHASLWSWLRFPWFLKMNFATEAKNRPPPLLSSPYSYILTTYVPLLRLKVPCQPREDNWHSWSVQFREHGTRNCEATFTSVCIYGNSQTILQIACLCVTNLTNVNIAEIYSWHATNIFRMERYWVNIKYQTKVAYISQLERALTLFHYIKSNSRIFYTCKIYTYVNICS